MARRCRHLVTALACLGVACEVPRPDGAYSPDAEDVVSAPDPVEAVTDGEIPDLGSSDAIEPPTSDAAAGDMDVDAGAVMGEEPPLIVLQKELAGDYWMRIDFYGTADSSGVQVDSHTVAFSLVRVGIDAEGTLRLVDWQCIVNILQTCVSGCASATTTISPEGARAYRPAVRKLILDVDTGEFSTTPEWFATGWRGSSSEDASAVLPARESDERVYDPDGGGPGVNVHVAVDASGLLPDVSCTMRIAQRYVQTYSGTLVGRAFERGSVADEDSEQVVLSYGGCPGGGSSRRAAPATMRLVRSRVSIDEQWTCPTAGAFLELLAEP